MVSLLPPSATALERALSLAKQHDQLATLCDAPQNVRVDPPASFVPWLLAEYGLADFIDYFDDHRALLNQGKAWVVVRGTGAAVRQALGWVGIDATLEEDGWRLQIDPGHESAIAQLKAILHLTSRSTPAHVQLYRLYHFYDQRHVVLDAGRLDDGQLDDDSGVWKDGVKLSFGTRHVVRMALEDPALQPIMTPLASSTIHNDNSWRLDAWALDSEILLDAAGGLVNQVGYSFPIELDGLIVRTRDDAMAYTIAMEAQPAIKDRQDNTSTTIPDDGRKWTGSWAGTWREVIPFKLTNEVA